MARRSSLAAALGGPKRNSEPKRSVVPKVMGNFDSKNTTLYRCGLMNIVGVGNELDQSLLPNGCDKKVVSASIKFTLDGRAFKSGVVKYSKDSKFGGTHEWIWQCNPAELAQKELVVEYALLRLKKKTLMCFIAGQAKIDALSIATGPCKWELELFSVKENKSVGFIKFEMHIEQFTNAQLHATFTVAPNNGSVPRDLHPELIQLPLVTDTRISDLPRQVERSLEELNASDYTITTRYEASLKGALLVILAPKARTPNANPVIGSYFRIPIIEILTLENRKVSYETRLINRDKIIGKVTATLTWSNLPAYSQLEGGFYNSRVGLTGGHVVLSGVHPTVIKGQRHNIDVKTPSVAVSLDTTSIIHDDNDDAKAPMRRKLQSKPSQMFGGFTAEVDESRITEAKQFIAPAASGEDDNWSDVGLDSLTTEQVDRSQIKLVRVESFRKPQLQQSSGSLSVSPSSARSEKPTLTKRPAFLSNNTLSVNPQLLSQQQETQQVQQAQQQMQVQMAQLQLQQQQQQRVQQTPPPQAPYQAPSQAPNPFAVPSTYNPFAAVGTAYPSAPNPFTTQVPAGLPTASPLATATPNPFLVKTGSQAGLPPANPFATIPPGAAPNPFATNPFLPK